MPRKSVKDRNTRKLVKSGKKSFSLTIPIELIKELGWRLRQKVSVKRYRRGVLIKDWKKREKGSIKILLLVSIVVIVTGLIIGKYGQNLYYNYEYNKLLRESNKAIVKYPTQPSVNFPTPTPDNVENKERTAVSPYVRCGIDWMMKDFPSSKDCNYKLTWNSKTKQSQLTKDSIVLQTVSISDTPSSARVYLNTNLFVIDTRKQNSNDESDGSVGTSYKLINGKLVKIFGGQKLEPGWQSTGSSAISFSPLGNYVLINEYAYEGYASARVFSLKENKEVYSLKGYGWVYAYWNPSGTCILNLSRPGMYEVRFDIIDLTDNTKTSLDPTSLISYNGYIESSDFYDYIDLSIPDTDIYWSNNSCSGYIKFDNSSVYFDKKGINTSNIPKGNYTKAESPVTYEFPVQVVIK